MKRKNKGHNIIMIIVSCYPDDPKEGKHDKIVGVAVEEERIGTGCLLAVNAGKVWPSLEFLSSSSVCADGNLQVREDDVLSKI
jgi:hypothetical protein